jgi:DNA mismatch endonuclease (patch repair protein)
MRAVKAKGTGAEKRCEALLRALGIRFQSNVWNLPGRPDFLCRGANIAIFVHGCFWHGHEGCKHAAQPASNTEYWQEKIARNKRRDERVRKELRGRGYRTAVVWECKLRNSESVSRRLLRLVNSPPRRKKLG